MKLLKKVIVRHWKKCLIERNVPGKNKYGSPVEGNWSEIENDVLCVISVNKVSYENWLESGVGWYRKTTHKARFLLGQNIIARDRITIWGIRYVVRSVEPVQWIGEEDDHLLSFVDKVEWLK
jgi:hypothetical protein